MSLQGGTFDALANSNWPLLEHLDASGCSCIHLVSAANGCRWPKLKYFRASNIGHASKFTTVLPLLETVALTGPIRQFECLEKLLSMGLPSLRSFTLHKHWEDSTVCSEDLVSANWTRLQCLQLIGVQFGPSSLAPLQQAAWPLLQQLDLRYSSLGNEALSQLVACNWPCMKVLNLSSNLFSAEGVQTLDQANWPHLEVLKLRRLSLGAQAVRHLVTATWPMLTNLNLDCNFLDTEAFQVLLKGQWPQLQELDLRRNHCRAEHVYDACKECLASEVCAYGSLLQSFVDYFANAIPCGDWEKVPLHLLAPKA